MRVQPASAEPTRTQIVRGQANFVGQRSRKRIAPFRLHRPPDAAEAIAIWRDTGATPMAGAVDLINAMKAGQAFDEVVELSGVSAWREIEVAEDSVRLGALVTHHQLAVAMLPPQLRGFAGRWHDVANPRVRIKGTLGGNVMAGNRNYDLAPCLEALGGRLHGVDRAGRAIELTAPEAMGRRGEICLTGIVIPALPVAFAYERSHRPLASVAVAALGDGDAVSRVRVAVGCAYERPIVVDLELPRVTALSRLGTIAGELAERIVATVPAPADTIEASGVYRKALLGVLARRLIGQLGEVTR